VKSRRSQSIADLAIVALRRSYSAVPRSAPPIPLGSSRPTGNEEGCILTGAPPQTPGFSQAFLRRSMTLPNETAPAPTGRTGASQERHRRAIGLVIPCRVASPQSPTPFHQTYDTMHYGNARKQDSTSQENKTIDGRPPQEPTIPADLPRLLPDRRLDLRHRCEKIWIGLGAPGSMIVKTPGSMILKSHSDHAFCRGGGSRGRRWDTSARRIGRSNPAPCS